MMICTRCLVLELINIFVREMVRAAGKPHTSNKRVPAFHVLLYIGPRLDRSLNEL